MFKGVDNSFRISLFRSVFIIFIYIFEWHFLFDLFHLLYFFYFLIINKYFSHFYRWKLYFIRGGSRDLLHTFYFYSFFPRFSIMIHFFLNFFEGVDRFWSDDPPPSNTRNCDIFYSILFKLLLLLLITSFLYYRGWARIICFNSFFF